MRARRPWLRRWILATVLAAALGWVPYQLYGRSSLARLMKLRTEVAALRAGNAELRARNRELRSELSLYNDDELAAVERIARDELGLVKPGEIVFSLEESAE